MDEAKEFFALQEETAHRVAHAVGVTSAARAALDELKRRRAAGEDAVIWHEGRRWLVGPRPIAPPAAALREAAAKLNKRRERQKEKA